MRQDCRAPRGLRVAPAGGVWGTGRLHSVPALRDAHDKNNRADRFHVIATLLGPAVGGREIGGLYERRQGEADIRSLKSAMGMGIPRCQTPGTVEKEVWPPCWRTTCPAR